MLDGGNIIANSIAANQINTSTITVGSLSDGSNYSTTSQMNGAISDAIEDVAIEIKTTNGGVVTITDANNYPALDLVADINPIQGLHGYDKPWVGGAGKNLANIDAVTDGTVTGESVAVSGSANYQAAHIVVSLKGGTTYTFSAKATRVDAIARISFRNLTGGQNLAQSAQITSAGNLSVSYTPSSDVSVRLAMFSTFGTANPSATTVYEDIQLEVGSAPTTYEPYENICPISGHTEVDVVVSPTTDASDGNTYTTALGRTVYGGTLDVVSGELTVTHEIVNLGELSWTRNNSEYSYPYFYSQGLANYSYTTDMLCDRYPVVNGGKGNLTTDNTLSFHSSSSTRIVIRNDSYTDATTFKASLSGAQLVYKLKTPQTYQLTPQQVELLTGTNYVWADTGDVYVKYAIMPQSVEDTVGLARKVATNYITEDETGIKVNNANDTSSYAHIDYTGMEIYQNNDSVAKFGKVTRIGEENGARVEIDSDTVRALTEDGAEAFSIESSSQALAQFITKSVSGLVINGNTTGTKTYSFLSDAVATKLVRIRFFYQYQPQGKNYTSGVDAWVDFVKGTSSTETVTFTDYIDNVATTINIPIAYDGANLFVITNNSRYYVSISSVGYYGQNIPIPETNFSGLFFLNGVNLEQPTLDTTTLTPYSSRCEIVDGGIFRFGKWRFIQINVQISDISLGANNTWAILEGLSNDLPLTYGRDTSNNLVKMANLSASAQKNAGDISAYINRDGKGETMNTFIKYTLIRAIRTICQTAVAVIGTAFVLSDVNWWAVVSASLLAGILSVLTSVATGLPEVEYENYMYMNADEPEDSEDENE